MPFGYLEFSRAIGRDLCPHMRARAAAGGGGRPAGAGAGPGRARAWAWVRVRVPYPTWFLLNRVWVSGSEPTRSKTVGIPTVATVRLPTVVTVGCIFWAANRHDCWVERVQPFIEFEPVGPSCRLYKVLLSLN